MSQEPQLGESSPSTPNATGVTAPALPGSAGNTGIISCLLPPLVPGAAFLGWKERECKEKDKNVACGGSKN